MKLYESWIHYKFVNCTSSCQVEHYVGCYSCTGCQFVVEYKKAGCHYYNTYDFYSICWQLKGFRCSATLPATCQVVMLFYYILNWIPLSFLMSFHTLLLDKHSLLHAIVYIYNCFKCLSIFELHGAIQIILLTYLLTLFCIILQLD